jgi:hypothetical protein
MCMRVHMHMHIANEHAPPARILRRTLGRTRSATSLGLPAAPAALPALPAPTPRRHGEPPRPRRPRLP